VKSPTRRHKIYRAGLLTKLSSALAFSDLSASG